MRILKNLQTKESHLQIMTLTVNSAFKESIQGACNAQDRFSAKFRALYIRGMHQNERYLPDHCNFFTHKWTFCKDCLVNG